MTYTAESACAALQSGEATFQSIAVTTGWPVVRSWEHGDCLIPAPEKWTADDGNAEVEYECQRGIDAAEQYVSEGEWGDVTETTWIKVWASRKGISEEGEVVKVSESHKITLDPEEPECVDGEKHDWQSPFAIVGGCKENPGVYGHGGGVTIDEVCMRCGCGKTTDTWAQDPDDGEQGLESVRYEVGKYREQIEATAQEEE